jgi:hypothetical protein
MVLALWTSLVIAATPPPTEGPLVPWYVPRSLELGVFINDPMVTPHFRIAWEASIISQPRNDLIWTVALGSGVGANPQRPMSAHYQHAVVAGLGYRSDRQVLHWGFHAAAGVVWYRAAYLPGSIYPFESRVLGYIEGRVQLGLRLTPWLKGAVYFGYASPFVFQRQYPGNTFVGGIDTGVVFDWR